MKFVKNIYMQNENVIDTFDSKHRQSLFLFLLIQGRGCDMRGGGKNKSFMEGNF